MSLASQVAALEAERDELARRLAGHDRHTADVATRMYRRGYHAGYTVASRGAPAVTNPERNARGELRQMLKAAAT